MTRTPLRDETGSILPLVAGFTALALTIALLVAAATSLYLERKRLLSLADSAALVGAEAYDLADVTATDGNVRVELADEDVSTAVQQYLEGVPDTFEELRIEEATSVDGRSATVELSAQWHPPVVSLFVPEGLRVDVTSTARSVFSSSRSPRTTTRRRARS